MANTPNPVLKYTALGLFLLGCYPFYELFRARPQDTDLEANAWFGIAAFILVPIGVVLWGLAAFVYSRARNPSNSSD